MLCTGCLRTFALVNMVDNIISVDSTLFLCGQARQRTNMLAAHGFIAAPVFISDRVLHFFFAFALAAKDRLCGHGHGNAARYVAMKREKPRSHSFLPEIAPLACSGCKGLADIPPERDDL